MTRFWEFNPASMLDVLPSAEGFGVSPANTGPAPVCPVCHQFIGMLEWLPPFRVELTLVDAQWDDWIRLPGNEFLVSEAYVDVHCSHAFTGLAPFLPVEVAQVRYRTKQKPLPPTYFMTKVLRSDARIDELESGLIREPSEANCSYCGGSSEVFRDRLVLESGTWRGEDWFIPQNLLKAMATDRVVQAISKGGLTGWKFERCERAKYRVHWPRDARGRQLPL